MVRMKVTLFYNFKCFDRNLRNRNLGGNSRKSTRRIHRIQGSETGRALCSWKNAREGVIWKICFIRPPSDLFLTISTHGRSKRLRSSRRQGGNKGLYRRTKSCSTGSRQLLERSKTKQNITFGQISEKTLKPDFSSPSFGNIIFQVGFNSALVSLYDVSGWTRFNGNPQFF